MVPIEKCFEAQYKEKKGSNMQEVILMKKSIHWFMKKMVIKMRDIKRIGR